MIRINLRKICDLVVSCQVSFQILLVPKIYILVASVTLNYGFTHIGKTLKISNKWIHIVTLRLP
jgi:hypothetical protein